MNSIRFIFEKIKDLLTPTVVYENKTLHDVLFDEEYRLDEITYSDLMLDEFNRKYNRTFTSYGDEMFDHWLKTVKSRSQIESLQRDMASLHENPHMPKISQLLKSVGKQYRGNIVSDLWSGFQIKSFIIDKALAIFILNIALSVALSFLFSQLIPLWIILFFINNLFIYAGSNYYISRVAGSINYLVKAIVFIKTIDKKELHLLERAIPRYRPLKKIIWSGYLFKEGIGGPQSGDIITMLFDYFRVFFCLEILSYKMTSKYVLNNIDTIRDVITFVGYYDSVVNNLKLMEDCNVSFSKVLDRGGIEFEDLRHPLLENPTSQSRSIEKGIIITGLNMAGKSTFMKSVGLNQLLATSMGITFSRKFSTSVRYIATSFRINDLLLEQKSRYFAEAERIVSLNETVHNSNALCLIDEILSGTNSDDRIAGSIKILRNMAGNSRSIIISATHDIKIAESLAGEYDTCYFDGTLENDSIEFDYNLKDGIVDKRNGLLILKTLGIEI